MARKIYNLEISQNEYLGEENLIAKINTDDINEAVEFMNTHLHEGGDTISPFNSYLLPKFAFEDIRFNVTHEINELTDEYEPFYQVSTDKDKNRSQCF